MKRNPQKYTFKRAGSRAKGSSGKGTVRTRARHRRRY